MTSHDRVSQPHALASETGFPALASRTDFLSQILTLIRLRGEVVFSAKLHAPWALRFEPGSGYFHVVSEGELLLAAQDGKVVHALAGDLLVMPQGTGHAIGTPGASPAEARDVLAAQLRDDSLAIHIGDSGPCTRMITGAFRFEGDNIPSMLAVLPSVIHIPGSLETEDKGWLAALADARISRALKVFHDEPFLRRTVAELAGMAGMSRSNFAERFSTLVGAGPLHYQTRWRLLLASDMLRRSDILVSEVARRVGYGSDAAFSRAFKAQFGMPPTTVRGN